MWKRIEKLYEKRGPITPSVRAISGDQRATPAVLAFLRDTRVRRMISLAPRGENWWEEEGSSENEGVEGGPGPPSNGFFSFSFPWVRLSSGAVSLCSFFCLSLSVVGGSTMTGSVGLWPGKMDI